VADEQVAPSKVTKDAAAKRLAQKHYEIETGLTRIFRVTGPCDTESGEAEPIKLLEVNEATAPTGVMPLHFGPVPASGIPYPSVILEVTPGEYEEIITEKIKLPSGWTIGEELSKNGCE
jgi:hypothetical protein